MTGLAAPEWRWTYAHEPRRRDRPQRREDTHLAERSSRGAWERGPPLRLPGPARFPARVARPPPIDEAASLAAQLPIFIRGIFYEGWDPSGTPEHARSVDSFLARIANEAGLAGATEASIAATAANRVLTRHISAGEAGSVLHELSRHLRALLTPEAMLDDG